MTRAETCALTHPLRCASAPMPNACGTRVYVICGFQGCDRRRDVGTAVWEAEVERRGQGSLEVPPLEETP